MSGDQGPSNLLLQRYVNDVTKHVIQHYPDYLHAWLVAKGASKYGPFHAKGIGWEGFRSRIAPYLLTRDLPGLARVVPLPCRNAGRVDLNWKDVTLAEAMRGGYFWRQELTIGRYIEKEAVQKLGGLNLGAAVSRDPMISGMGPGLDKRDLVGKELAWNEGVEDESMWNESDGEGGDAGTSGGKRWFPHQPDGTSRKKRARSTFEEDEDEGMMMDKEQDPVAETHGRQRRRAGTGRKRQRA